MVLASAGLWEFIMAIRIIRKGAANKPKPAEIVTGTPKKKAAEPAADTLPPPRPAKEAVQDWKENHPAVGQQATQCLWCKQFYIVPCADTDKALSCINYLWLRNRTAETKEATS